MSGLSGPTVDAGNDDALRARWQYNGSTADATLVIKDEVLYACGHTRNDRCTVADRDRGPADPGRSPPAVDPAAKHEGHVHTAEQRQPRQRARIFCMADLNVDVGETTLRRCSTPARIRRGSRTRIRPTAS